MGSSMEQKLQILLEPLILAHGYELVHIEYQKEGSDWFLRIFIDSDQGVGLEDCQRVSEVVSEKLDYNDPIPYSYILEVSSPGVERPLKKEKDFQRYKGEVVQLRTFSPINGQKNFRGRLQDFENNKIKLEIDGSILIIPLEDVSKARLLVEF